LRERWKQQTVRLRVRHQRPARQQPQLEAAMLPRARVLLVAEELLRPEPEEAWPEQQHCQPVRAAA
jgi:hypothetical protein